MFFFGYDPTWYLLIPGLILAFWAQAKVSSTFARYSRVRSRRGLTGAQVARAMLNQAGLHNVAVEPIPGNLTDHYDPRHQVVRLSPAVYHEDSLAALGVAAHETGHALQHARGYAPLGIRNSLFPVANLGSTLAFPLFVLGFLFGGRSGVWFMDLGILLFTGALLFQVVTLPVELNASRRAVALLEEGGYLLPEETDGAWQVLSAAAWTYVAAALVAVLQLVRLLMLRGSRDD
ncbi:MAG: zinc metallopeptidase [Bacillota bacterium]|nr:zinc metallopeptidase [Bacillota bacterium]